MNKITIIFSNYFYVIKTTFKIFNKLNRFNYWSFILIDVLICIITYIVSQHIQNFNLFYGYSLILIPTRLLSMMKRLYDVGMPRYSVLIWLIMWGIMFMYMFKDNAFYGVALMIVYLLYTIYLLVGLVLPSKND